MRKKSHETWDFFRIQATTVDHQIKSAFRRREKFPKLFTFFNNIVISVDIVP